MGDQPRPCGAARASRPHPGPPHPGPPHPGPPHPGLQPDTAAGEAVLAAAVEAYQAAMGPRLIAVYALGSLAHGGFSPLVSDVDVGLILAGPLRPLDRRAVGRAAAVVRGGGTDLHERLSVFWGTPQTLRGQRRGGRFPPLDRLDLIEHGRLLTGRDARAGLPRPGQPELLTAGARFALAYLAGTGPPGVAGGPARLRGLAAGRRLDGGPLAEIRTPALLAGRGPRRLTRVVLFPVRFLFTAQTGQAGPVTVAAGRYLAGSQAAAAELVSAALSWRYQPPSGPAAEVLLERHLVPLYVEYLDDQIPRLLAAGQPGLAGGLRRWRARLLS